ncbi:hypothetical protein [Paraflavitalea speifideaquila]|uniref:hypothetical protein n=1 Tax=Paraflavitalea speifideaquila TaxID=3076558 RepID=UPI0028E6DC72|nr:hypothetical protein [Paraflavitalea speifideiaquila]
MPGGPATKNKTTAAIIRHFHQMFSKGERHEYLQHILYGFATAEDDRLPLDGFERCPIIHFIQYISALIQVQQKLYGQQGALLLSGHFPFSRLTFHISIASRYQYLFLFLKQVIDKALAGFFQALLYILAATIGCGIF